MASEIKIYYVEGKMLIAHDKVPTWQKFGILVRAVKPEHAIEKVLSDLGSRHKLKRRHIKIESIREVKLEEVKDPYIIALSRLERWVKVE
ncbi:50S ribosomal protein L18a [Candidatus Geothermarchaeota archaeon]|nr:MAG: 50S ribosomal protein L18a [Candidatus Geothermarchaeota archaeon]